VALRPDPIRPNEREGCRFCPIRCVPLRLMRLIVARCEVRYSGRLDALLPEALRLLMIKSDGSVMVHADTGGYKPQKSSLT
jgi:RecB family endonuclease NucS